MCVCELPHAHVEEHRCECTAEWRDPEPTEPATVDGMDKSELYALDLTDAVWHRAGRTLDMPKKYNCVEWATLPGGAVAVRDSNNHAAGTLMFTPGEWDAFTDGIRTGDVRAV